MAMSKGFRVLEKSKPPSPHSILLEHRNKSDALLFESQAVAVLCKSNPRSGKCNIDMKKIDRMLLFQRLKRLKSFVKITQKSKMHMVALVYCN